MKNLLKEMFKNATAIAFGSSVFGGLSYKGDFFVLLMASLVFSLINYYLKPIIKIFLLPINLLTLGMFRWLTGVFCLLLLTIMIPEIRVQSYQYPGLNYHGFSLPPFYFSTFLSLIFSSFLISISSEFIDWLIKK